MSNPMCAIDGCQTLSKARGLCTRHYQSEAKAGRLASFPIRRPPVGYYGAHRRLTQAIGQASLHTCIDCGERAKEWSYIGGAPDEIVAKEGAFSLDPNYYKPRCVPCHRAHDLVTGTCRKGHPFTEANTYVSKKGKRGCRVCRNEASRRWAA